LRGGRFGGMGEPGAATSGAGSSSSNWGSRNVDLFDKIEQVGEGTYG